MRIFLSVLLLTAFITSCAGNSDRKIDPSTGLTKEDYEQTKLINTAIEDVRVAVDISLNRFVPTGAPSEKAVELSKGINKSNCTLTIQEPSDRYDSDWTGEKTALGLNCPLRTQRTWTFKNNARRLEFKEQFTAQSDDFKKKSAAQSFGIEQGYLYADKSNSSVQRIFGRISYSNISIQGVGLVVAELTSAQENTSTRTQGQLVLQMESRSNLNVRVDVNWFNGRAPQYRVNGSNVDESVVLELFSAFGIKEMIDRSMKMR